MIGGVGGSMASRAHGSCLPKHVPKQSQRIRMRQCSCMRACDPTARLAAATSWLVRRLLPRLQGAGLGWPLVPAAHLHGRHALHHVVGVILVGTSCSIGGAAQQDQRCGGLRRGVGVGWGVRRRLGGGEPAEQLQRRPSRLCRILPPMMVACTGRWCFCLHGAAGTVHMQHMSALGACRGAKPAPPVGS